MGVIMDYNSDFTGGLLELIAITLIQYVIIVFTLGFATPFAITFKQRWVASHTYIEGYQLKFVGNAGDLLIQWVKWLLLTFITLGIYGLWVGLKMQQWVARNTIFNN